MGRRKCEENVKYRNIEKLLYSVPKNRIKIRNLKLELERVTNSYRGCGGFVIEERVGNTYKITSTVEDEVVAKEEKEEVLKRRIRTLEIEVEKVDNALSILTPRELEIVELLYFKQMRNKDVAQQLLFTQQYFAYLKTSILDKLIDYIYVGCEETIK